MEGKLIGVVFDYFEHVHVIAIKLKESLKLGDTIRVVGGDIDFTEVVDSMQINRTNVSSAKKGDEVGIKVSEKARKDYRVFKL